MNPLLSGCTFGNCTYYDCDSSEIYIRFTPPSIEPGESTIMKLWIVDSLYEYNEENYDILQKTITIEPECGQLIYLGGGEYLFTAPDTLTVDSVAITINYENYNQFCARWDAGEEERIIVKDNFNCIDCPLPFLSILSRDYASGQLTIAWDSLDVKVVPDTIYPGDTAQVVIKKRLPDGTLTDFDSTQTYEVGMLDGCILGKIVAGEEEGPHVVDVFQPIYFVADTSADTTGSVLLRVGLVEPYDFKKPNKEKLQTDILESDCFFGWQSNSYDNVFVVKDKPLEIIYPTPLINELITDDPQMPEVICKARLKKFYMGIIKYEWKYIVQKTYNRRKSDNGNSICDRISKCEFQGVSYSNVAGQITEWTVPFIKDSGYFYFKAVQNFQDRYNPKPYYGCGGAVNYWYDETSDEIFTAGNVSITLIAKYYQTGEVIARLENVRLNKILGENPADPETYGTYANSNKIKAILWKEGRYRQFTHQETDPNQLWPYDGDGWPLYGEPNGYGIMQLDNTPAATERQLWNWKANVDGGKQKLNKIITKVDEYIAKKRATNEEKYRLTNAFHDYHIGNYTYYYIWEGRKWDINPNRGYDGKKKSEYGKIVYNKYTELGGGN